MRNVLFRGKRTMRPQCWVYGSLIRSGQYCCILDENDDYYDHPYLDGDLGTIDGKATPVIPETVCQFTGLLDKNGRRIFEGDIVKTEFGRLCTVVWFSTQTHCGWDLKVVNTPENVLHTKPPTAVGLWKSENLEVVSNIHDNI